MGLIMVAAVRFAHADWLACCAALRGANSATRGDLLLASIKASGRLHKAWSNAWTHAPAYAAALHDEIHGRIA